MFEELGEAFDTKSASNLFNINDVEKYLIEMRQGELQTLQRNLIESHGIY